MFSKLGRLSKTESEVHVKIGGGGENYTAKSIIICIIRATTRSFIKIFGVGGPCITHAGNENYL